MTMFPPMNCWRAEGLKLSRQPVAWMALGALLLALLAAAIDAGLRAGAWRAAAVQDATQHAASLQRATDQLDRAVAGPGRAVATHQVARSDLGATRMPVAAGLALGVQRLDALPVRVTVSLDSRLAHARDPGPLRNPLLTDTGLPGVPAMVALLLPLAALVLCGGLLQEEREHGRLPLLRLQSARGLRPLLIAALGWRWGALWAVAAVATLPALALDPGAHVGVACAWLAGLAAFSAFWVAVGGLLSCAPISGATSLLASLGLWLALTFAVPAGLARLAQQAAPLPSRLASVVEMRAAQQEGEDHEAELAAAWYAAHPGVPTHLPAVWPASFLPRTLALDQALQPTLRKFSEARSQQARFIVQWCWTSPGLALVLLGEGLAATDAGAHARYLEQVDAFEARWRAFFIPSVMDRHGLEADRLHERPRFGSTVE